MQQIHPSPGTLGRPRARDLGLPFGGDTGPNNAITDVPGVRVGYATLIDGSGPLRAGQGPVRTGVTVILPPGASDRIDPVWAALYSLNGNGEVTGAHWIHESGQFAGPIAITNTHSVGMVHHALARWISERREQRVDGYSWALPVVAETYDGYLNDIDGQHVTAEHVQSAIAGASDGPIAEGNVGGGTGMICYEFKGGTGTASRTVRLSGATYTVGALVQANHGIRPWLNVLGVPVGTALDGDRLWMREQGSIIAVVATDAPLLPIQLQRVARRITIGVGRTGTPSGDNSGDIFLAFSTANRESGPTADGLCRMSFLPHRVLDDIFVAAVDSVEEAIINAMVAAETMVGRDGNVVTAIDHDALRAKMRAHGRLLESA